MKNRLPILLALVVLCGMPAIVHAQTYNIYFGDIHSQTWYSDGNKEQSQGAYTLPVARAITYARDVANDMDFLGVSDHNHNESLNMTLPYWRSGNREADSVNHDGVFVGMYGQEWGTISGGGHVLVYGTDRLFGWNPGVYDVYVPKSNYALLIDSVRKYNGFAYLAHPQTTDYSNLIGTAYKATWDSVIQGVAMKNGPALDAQYGENDPASGNYESYFHSMLKLGYHVAPIANQDNHYTNFGMLNQQRTAVLATSLTRANILDALRNRRAYATEDHNLQLRLEVGTHQMGEVFMQGSPIPIRVKVVDPDGVVSSIQLRYGVPGSGSVPTTLTSVSNVDSLLISQSQDVGTTYYYYAYVTETSGRHAWSAPMWITVPTGPPPSSFSLLSPTNSTVDQPIDGTLSWDAATNATQYDIYLGTSNPPTTLVSADQATTSYSYSGLTNNTAYFWKVVAKNVNGSLIATGAPWSFNTIIAAPSSFSLQSPPDSAVNQPIGGTISWQSSPNAAQYDVYLDANNPPTTMVSSNQPGTTYAYSGLNNSQMYYWKVVAKNSVGNVVASGAPWKFIIIGPSPSTFQLALPPNSISNQLPTGTLSWNPASGAVNYDVYLDTSSSPTTLVASNVTDTAYAYSSLSPGKTYYWKVIAKNANGSSAASDAPRYFIIANVPIAASGLAITDVTTNSLKLTWTDNAFDEFGYRIFRATSSGGPFEQIGPDQPVNSISYIDSGLQINQEYYFQVIPFNNIGQGVAAPANKATLAVVPGSSTISNDTYSSLLLTLDPAANPSTTQFAITVTVDSTVVYVQMNGTLGATADWRSYAEWGSSGGKQITGLQSCKLYGFGVKARNEDHVETLPCPPATKQLTCFSLSHVTETGWNLISLPVNAPDPRRIFLFPTSVSDAFAYLVGYVRRDSLRHGLGYWMKFDANDNLTLAGEPRLSDTIAVVTGWNLIGSISAPIHVSAVQQQPGGIVSSNYFGFNGAYFQADSIRPMQSYWMKANAPGSLVLSSTGIMPAIAGKNSSNELKTFDEFAVEDGAGKRQTLYIARDFAKDESKSLYELPPSPPSGSFDARFESQRSVEFIAANIQSQRFPIIVQSLSRPLKFYWMKNAQPTGQVHYRLIDGLTSIPLREGSSVILEKGDSRVILVAELSSAQSIPKSFALYQNYPNPFNPSTRIQFDLPASSIVSLKIFNMIGEIVQTIVDNQRMEAGVQYATMDAAQLPAGVYVYRLSAEDVNGKTFMSVRKMILLK